MRLYAYFFLSLFVFVANDVVLAKSSQEKAGRELYEKILEEVPIYEDEALVGYVKSIGAKVVAVSDHRNITFTFTVIDDETINAFALPGGYIFIHRGLIAYLNSEAELAAVLAHEVAHITEKHHSRQKNAATSSQFLAGVLGVLTGSYDVAEAGAIWGATVVSGFGREMELEADEVGAEYMHMAGYDPRAMIETVSLLKDNERLQKKKDRAKGKKTPNYHGLFATHPRNDKRLREAVAKAGNLPDKPNAELNITPFRVATEGMIWGKHYGSKAIPENIYQDEKRAFRLTIPDGWVFHGSSTGGSGESEGKKANLKLTVETRTLESPEQYIKNQLNIPLIKKSEPLDQYRLKGHTGLVPDKTDMRVAVIYYGRYAYVFEGAVADGKALSNDQEKILDGEMLKIIKSFRPVSKKALAGRQPKVIHYVKATEATTYARLANHLKLGQFGEDELRIINGYYPRGEPKPGEWIKIIK